MTPDQERQLQERAKALLPLAIDLLEGLLTGRKRIVVESEVTDTSGPGATRTVVLIQDVPAA